MTLDSLLPTSQLPRWRGFNLLERYRHDWNVGNFRESDFDWIAEWGFDFIRLPVSYRFWATDDPDHWLNIDESAFAEVDRAIAMGRQRRIHINLNLHRLPGYCVNAPAERLSLWDDPRALDAAAHHWSYIARRYRGIPSTALSFNLLNEAPYFGEERYAPVIRRLIEAVRCEDALRLIIIDGLSHGNVPVEAAAELRVGLSTRGYTPMGVSHYRAHWVRGAENWPPPDWPITEKIGCRLINWDKERLYRERIAPFQSIEQRGVGIHVGEWGAHNRTPHHVTLRWMRDCLELWRDAGWGWALWNFRGSFGILDSERNDVAYEGFRGSALDRRMLELLREF